MLISLAKQMIKLTVSPSNIHHCSQTIYEALLGCLRMWEVTKAPLWKDRSRRLLNYLIGIQKPDGGFDIGYDFNFGMLHKKGLSTSPELVGLMAACEYARIFGDAEADSVAHKAAAWIRLHAMHIENEKWAIPYSPYTTPKVMVYNGTSFACGALGCYLGQFGGDEQLHSIYNGMVNYLESVLYASDGLPGRFWYYNDQSRTDLDELRRNKIDYYHQMQQVEIHALAQNATPLEKQIKIIHDASEHIIGLYLRFPILPYTNDPRLFNNQIHTWGFASVVSGLLEAAELLDQRRDDYRKVAYNLLLWLLVNAWNGKYFEPVLNRNRSRGLPVSSMTF